MSLEDVLSKAASWPGTAQLSKVQDLLDKNKLIINEIHHNHELRTPDSLQRNVVLIRELNANIARVVSSYEELSSLITEDSTLAAGGPAAMVS